MATSFLRCALLRSERWPPPIGALRPVWLGGESFAGQAPQADLTPVALPVDFEGRHFEGWEADRVEAQAGTGWDVFTHWALSKLIAPSLKIFIHVTAPDGKIVAQWDGLDVNVGTLEVGDMFRPAPSA